MEKTRYEGIKSLIRLTPVGFAAVSVYAVLVFFLFARRFDKALTVAAFCGIFVTALTGIFTASRDIRQGIPDTRFLRARYAALNFALSLFTLLFLWQLTRYAQGERLIFAGIIMFAYMTSGGLALCSCPPMQIAWLLPLSAGMAAMILRYAGGIALPLLLTLIFYIAVIVLFSCYFTRMLYLRFAAAAKVERQSELTRMLLDDFEKRARDWMLEVDSEGRVSHVSSRFAEMPGCTADKLTGRQFYEIMSGIVVPGEGEPYEEMYQRFRRERTPFQDEVLEVLINGERHWWMTSGQPTFTEAGEYTGWRFIGRDITEQKLHEVRMEWQATHDMQTGLFNRYHFLHIVENALKHTEDSALMRIDFINYRAIVTIRGQMAGDAVIREFGGRLKRFAGERVAAARTGTSGFALLIREDSSPALQNLAESIMSALKDPFPLGSDSVIPEVCAGMAIVDENTPDTEILTQCADLALTAAREDGAGTLRVFEPRLSEQYLNRLILLDDMDRAVRDGEFHLRYQPLISADTGDTVCAEALIRWQHPKRGMIPPGDFIPLAEQSGKIASIGEWVIRQACADAAAWALPWKVSVNISAEQLKRGNLAETIRAALQYSGLPAHRLNIEITESVLIGNHADIHRALREISSLGVSIAIDDFGSGFSSLQYLQSFPLNEIKIDQSFIRAIATGSEPVPIIEAIIMLAKKLGFYTVAEGVETPVQANRVKSLGCDCLQGFLYYRPMLQSDILSLQLGTAKPES
jgi:diguanylate cyclase (GGDEF)-like protein/PAS domain S-box-containing protein